MGKGRVSGKKIIDKRKRDNTSFSMNIGLIVTTIAIISIVKDFLMYFETVDSNVIGIFITVIVAIIAVLVLKLNLSEKIKNRKNIRDLIDSWTVYSIIVFLIENSLLSDIGGNEEKILGFLVLILILVTGTALTIWILFFKKDRKYNVD